MLAELSAFEFGIIWCVKYCVDTLRKRKMITNINFEQLLFTDKR